MSILTSICAALALLLSGGVRFRLLRPRCARSEFGSASTALAVSRGALNGLVVWLVLRKAAYPELAAIAEALVAGVQSGVVQLSAVNERYAQFLNAATEERERFLRWALLESTYLAGVKAAGALFGGGPDSALEFLGLYVRALSLASVQYPWMAAIAAARRGCDDRTPAQVRKAADLQTLVVSAVCVGLMVSNSVGAPLAPLASLLVGLAGLLVHARCRQRAVLTGPGSGRGRG